MLDFSKLVGTPIALEQKHIDAGIRGAVRHHPIALALDDVLDADTLAEICLIDPQLVFCNVMDNDRLGELHTTTDLQEWAWDYQNGVPVAPTMLIVFKDEDHDETDLFWIGIEPAHRTLVHVDQVGKEMDTLLLCDQHLTEMTELLESQPHKRLITIARHLKGICEVCATGDDEACTPITYHPIPDAITVHVVFLDGSTATWTAHGGVGKLDCLREDDGGTYTTMEALKARGVRCFTLENMHEVEVD